MSDAFSKFLQLDYAYSLGDVASILALVISSIGFTATLYQVVRSRRAAEQARDTLLRFDAIRTLTSAIQVFREIRTLHRQAFWPVLPDRYTSLRMELAAVRDRTPGLPVEHLKQLQAVVSQISVLERQVEGIINGAAPQISQLNIAVTRQINRLTDLLIQMQKAMEG